MNTLNQGSPHNINQYTKQTIPPPGDQFSVVLQRLDNIDKRLSQLDLIQSTVEKITDGLQKLDQRVSAMETKMVDLEHSRDFD